eukprot:365880-Chlamydomonas_euryale.AAC.6
MAAAVVPAERPVPASGEAVQGAVAAAAVAAAPGAREEPRVEGLPALLQAAAATVWRSVARLVTCAPPPRPWPPSPMGFDEAVAAAAALELPPARRGAAFSTRARVRENVGLASRPSKVASSAVVWTRLYMTVRKGRMWPKLCVAGKGRQPGNLSDCV